MSVSLLYLQVDAAKFLDIFNLAGVCMWLSRQKAKESGYLELYLIYYIKTLKCGQQCSRWCFCAILVMKQSHHSC